MSPVTPLNDYDRAAEELQEIQNILLASAHPNFLDNSDIDRDSLTITKNGFLQAVIRLQRKIEHLQGLAHARRENLPASLKLAHVFVVNAWEDNKQKECVVFFDYDAAAICRDGLIKSYGASNVCISSRTVNL